MNSKMTSLEITFQFIVTFGIPGTIAVIFLFFPHHIVRIQGKFYRRWYKDFANMSDDQINSFPMLPTDRFFLGDRAKFIREAPENPKKFTRLLIACRILGLLFILLLIPTFLIWLFAFVFG